MREKEIMESVLTRNPKPPTRDPRPTADMVLTRLAALRQYRMATVARPGRGRGRKAAAGVAAPATGVRARPGSAPPLAEVLMPAALASNHQMYQLGIQVSWREEGKGG